MHYLYKHSLVCGDRWRRPSGNPSHSPAIVMHWGDSLADVIGTQVLTGSEENRGWLFLFCSTRALWERLMSLRWVWWVHGVDVALLLSSEARCYCFRSCSDRPRVRGIVFILDSVPAIWYEGLGCLPSYQIAKASPLKRIGLHANVTSLSTNPTSAPQSRGIWPHLD